MKSTTAPEKQFQRKTSPLFKLSAAILSLIIIASCFSGCEKTVIATESPTSDRQFNNSPVLSVSESIKLGVSEEDSFNPYFMTSDLNTGLISLVYEPLFTVDDAFSPQPDLALSYTYENGSLTVKTDTSRLFSDGTAVSPQDVIYSFNLAKNSEYYKNELLNISSASAVSSDTVVFTTANNYANPADALHFPIVKSSTASTADAVPTGTGLYSVSASGENMTLVYNPLCKKPEPTVKTISLVKLPSSSTLFHVLELGEIDAFFDDMSSGSYSQGNASQSKTNLPNLVFLGINSESYSLSSAAVRQAVFYSINRQSIVKNSFKNYASEAYTPYHPQWHIFTGSKYDTDSFALDYTKAKSLMTNAGFTDQINLRLIVYSGNNFKVAAAKEIKESLLNIGINITVTELTWDKYTQALANGDYDFYLGEVKLPSDMNLSSLFGDSSVLYGVSASDTTKTAYKEYLSGNISINAFTDSFLQNMPLVPLCFRSGALVYSRSIKTAPDCDYLNPYKNIYEWTVEEALTEAASAKG